MTASCGSAPSPSPRDKSPSCSHMGGGKPSHCSLKQTDQQTDGAQTEGLSHTPYPAVPSTPMGRLETCLTLTVPSKGAALLFPPSVPLRSYFQQPYTSQPFFCPSACPKPGHCLTN